jgi:hypothetical protein
MNRYNGTPLVRGGRSYGTAKSANRIYWAIKNNIIPSRRIIIKESERLDVIAGRVYGASELWWVIAAASGIGWGLQVPPGTILFIPSSLKDIELIAG